MWLGLVWILLISSETLGLSKVIHSYICAIFQPLTSVKAKETLIAEDLFRTVKAVFVHQLPNKGSCGPLVLHSSLYQVDWIHRRCSRSFMNTNKFELKNVLNSWDVKLSQTSVGLTSGDGAQSKPVCWLCNLEPHRPGAISTGLSTKNMKYIKKM